MEEDALVEFVVGAELLLETRLIQRFSNIQIDSDRAGPDLY